MRDQWFYWMIRGAWFFDGTVVFARISGRRSKKPEGGYVGADPSHMREMLGEGVLPIV